MKEDEMRDMLEKEYGMNALNDFNHAGYLVNDIAREVTSITNSLKRILDIAVKHIRPKLQLGVFYEYTRRKYIRELEESIPKKDLREQLELIKEDMSHRTDADTQYHYLLG